MGFTNGLTPRLATAAVIGPICNLTLVSGRASFFSQHDPVLDVAATRLTGRVTDAVVVLDDRLYLAEPVKTILRDLRETDQKGRTATLAALAEELEFPPYEATSEETDFPVLRLAMRESAHSHHQLPAQYAFFQGQEMPIFLVWHHLGQSISPSSRADLLRGDAQALSFFLRTLYGNLERHEPGGMGLLSYSMGIALHLELSMQSFYENVAHRCSIPFLRLTSVQEERLLGRLWEFFGQARRSLDTAQDEPGLGVSYRSALDYLQWVR